MAGIRKQRIIFLVYLLSGVACGLAAVLWASRFESAQTNTALGFELQTVAASVVGGVSISGGVGTVPGVLLGALLLGIIQNALTLMRISPFWQLAAQGLLILIAVISDKWISRRIERKNQQMKATAASPTSETQSASLINENAPRSVIPGAFPALGVDAGRLDPGRDCAQHPALALFLGRPESLPYLFRLYGDRSDDAADGFYHYYRQH